MLFATEYTVASIVTAAKNLRKGILATNHFQLDKVENLVHLPHC